MEDLCNNFLKDSNEFNAYKLLYELRINNLNNLGVMIGKEFQKMFPKSFYLILEYARLWQKIDKYVSYMIYSYILSFKSLSYDSSNMILNEQIKLIDDNILNQFTEYNPDKIKQIQLKKKNIFPLVTLTITTCKRFDLFEKTINSVLNCFDIDKIDYWLCIDDNSSTEDRQKMQKLYPFFEFYFKYSNEKGHAKSMNIIKNKVTTPYILHLEDDWVFYNKKNYISDALAILYQDSKHGQCLFNKNYGELPDDLFKIKGGDFKTTNDGLRFYLHEYATTEDEIQKWSAKHTSGCSCYYWPHFSFRPSLLKRSVIESIGEYNENCEHFEREYAYRYINKGFISTFFEDNNCKHIGRLTSERNDISKLNAYDLNNTIQFEKVSSNFNNMEIILINLQRRPDRLEKFKKQIDKYSLNFTIFSAIDGYKLKPNRQLNKIFENNDYNMRKGIVGCALSHLQIWIELIKSNKDFYLIFEDDVTIQDNFKTKLRKILNDIDYKQYDILFLGHHSKIKDLNNVNNITIKKYNSVDSLKESYGGAFSYIITKNGAQKMLEYINTCGMPNAIDTMQQKAADFIDIYYIQPSLVTSDCHCFNNNIDTDIQKDINSTVSMNIENIITEELINLESFNIQSIKSYDELIKYIQNLHEHNIYYKNNDQNVIEKLFIICNMCLNKTHIYYTIESNILIILNKNDYNNFKPTIYNERLKKYNNYDISDAIVYI